MRVAIFTVYFAFYWYFSKLYFDIRLTVLFVKKENGLYLYKIIVYSNWNERRKSYNFKPKICLLFFCERIECGGVRGWGRLNFGNLGEWESTDLGGCEWEKGGQIFGHFYWHHEIILPWLKFEDKIIKTLISDSKQY